MVGLEGVKAGTAKKPEDMVISWGPKDLTFAAHKARTFTTEATMIFILDALDDYMKQLSKTPSPISDVNLKSLLASEFQLDKSEAQALTLTQIEQLAKSLSDDISDNDKSSEHILNFQRRHFGLRKRPSMANRFNGLTDVFGKAPEYYKSAIRLLISWRNRHVHKSSNDVIAQNEQECLIAASTIFKEEHSNLDIAMALENYRAKMAPTLKELSSMIAISHRVVETIDHSIIARTSMDDYIHDCLVYEFKRLDKAKDRIADYWSKSKEKKSKKLSSMLIPHGFFIEHYLCDKPSETPADRCLGTLSELSFNEIRNYLQLQ